MNRRTFHAVAILTLVSLALQLATMAAITRLRGSPVAYAFQSPDAVEYVALARGLACRGRFIPLDPTGHALGPPDTWRVPGYSIFLAMLIRCCGDDPMVLLLAQQLLAAATVPLLYRILARLTSSRWSLLAAFAWMFDPFRLYYSQWLLAETFFIFTILVGLLLYLRARRLGFTPARTIAIGLIAGAVVLIRPIGLLLPLLAVIGTAHAAFTFARPRPRRWLPAILCAASAAVVVCPWLARNYAVAGHASLSHQLGASFAYHKVADVILWSRGRHRDRFNPDALDEIRSEIDVRLRQKWEQRVGQLTPAQRDTLSWRKINFGQTGDLDPFVVSSLLKDVGWGELASRKTDLLACFAVQGIGMLIFPLNLVLDPPAGSGAAPLSLIGGGHSTAAQLVAALIGCAYATLVLIVIARCLAAAVHRHWPYACFALWPMLALFLPALPFEDPRFRLPLIPFLLILAVARSAPQRPKSP